MAKHRRKQAVYHNNMTDNWTNDAKEQLSLLPGSDGYEARQAKLVESNPMSKENLDEVAEEQFDLDEERKLEKKSHQFSDDFDESFTKGQKSASVLKYRAMARRQDAVRQTAKIASNGLDRTVTEKEIESVNDSITKRPEDVPRTLRNYEEELEDREIPTVDSNGDGKIDEDDAYITPGMKKMRKYM